MLTALTANNAETTLASGINASATTLTVVDGSQFPSPTGGNYAYVTIQENSTIEIVKVTARSSNSLTVVRAQDGTTAASFSSGATVALRVVKALFDETNARLTHRGALFYLNAATLSHPSGVIYFTFDTEAYDTDSFGAAGGTTITIPASLNGAFVRLSARAQWTTGESPLCTGFIEKNGVLIYPGVSSMQSRVTDSSDSSIVDLQTAILQVATDDVFKLYLTQTNIGDDTINVRGEGRTWFQIEVIQAP